MEIRRRAGLLSSLLVVAGSVLLARPVQAQSEMDSAARVSLLHQAEDASAANDHVRALDLAHRAAHIAMTISLRMFIAQEDFALGHFAEAFADSTTCVTEARRDTTARNRTAVLSECESIVARAEPHLGHVTLQVPAPAPAGLVVTVGGTAVNEAFFGAPYIVTPGNVVVHASAADGSSFDATVAVALGATVPVPVRLAGHAATPQTRHPSESSPSGQVATTTDTATHGSSSGSSPVPLVVAGIGVLGLIASGVMYAVSMSDASSVENSGGCVPVSGVYQCNPSATEMATATQGQSLYTGSLVVLGVGAGLAVIGGAWWFLTRHRGSTEHTAFMVAPTQGGAIVGIGGAL